MNRQILFIGLGVFILVNSIFIMIFDTFPMPLHGAFRVLALFGLAVFFTFNIGLAAILIEKKLPVIPAQDTEDDAAEILLECKNHVEKYLAENKSTPFFRSILGEISSKLIGFQNRYINIHDALETRFGVGGLSYDRFSSAVETQQNLLVKLVYNLLTKMKSFDENEYEEKINHFMVMNRPEEAEAHKAVEKEYKNHAEDVSKQLDKAIIKLDKLILEMARLNDSELAKAMNVLCNMDDVIKDTKLYGI